jgi:nitroimidazol reductase NimA-like FMN-containing flavoprotein (pyridoxamine 5'-phosphate oxidase superfamily)
MSHDGSWAIDQLATDQCWQLLRQVDVGRLAVVAAGLPEIFPVNFVIDHGTVVLRTSTGTKLTAATSTPDVAFEADGVEADPAVAWSVVIKGTASRLSAADLLDSTSLPLYPWQPGAKPRFLRITPLEISGRRFTRSDPREWEGPLQNAQRSATE